MKKGEIRSIQRRLERIESELDSIRAALKDYGIRIPEVVPDSGTIELDHMQKKNYAVKKNRSMEAGIKP